MVDPVNPNNPVPNITQSARPSQRERDVQAGDEVVSAPLDRVNISDEAQALADIEQLAGQAGAQIANDETAVLSGDAARLGALI